ncbi:P-loop containing nucleoside triphosphate hydrolase protein [Rhizophagus irregularis DAOM 181602=DAOM 197198]|nr:P-loop containing nucleoside triphosphate hydrolase protein [Rhizophagus irregularis DAOM 181602=DAOM 197198]
MIEEIKNILLVGRIGVGKSVLTNVISETKNFKESAGSISETAKAKARKFKMNYQVINTIVDKRFTKNEIDDFNWFSSYLFDVKVFDYTTVVQTHFPNFEDDNAFFSYNLYEQQLLSKKLEELIELKEKMEARKLINKNLEKRDSKIFKLISKFKDRLDEEEKKILDRLLDVQKEIAKAILEGEKKLELEKKLGSLKRKLENKLPKYWVDNLLYEKELITRSLILSGELEINERRQLQQEIIKYSVIIRLKDIRNKRNIKNLLSEKWLLKKFELENDDDSVSDDDSTSSVSFESFEKAKKIDLIMRIGEKTLELKRLIENIDKLYPTKESKKEVKEIAIDFYENPIEVVGGGKLILQGYHDLKKLIIDGDYLKSKLTELDVSDCYNLELLHCIENEPCSFDISNNNIQENGLEFLKDFVNLEVLSLGNYDESFSNNFTGSLESLKKLTKLKVLNIKNSVVEGVENLVDPACEEGYRCTVVL